MEFFSGYMFFIYLILLLIPAVIMGIKQINLRFYRIFLSLFFIYLIFKNTPIQLTYLIVYIALASYLVQVYLYLRKKYGRNRAIYLHALFFAVLPLIVYKLSITQGMNIFGFLGISYICFRVLQTIIEIYDGIITEINVLTFLEFLVFFPSLSSGPIDRSRRFFEDDSKKYAKEEYLELLSSGIYRIVQGLFYKIVCSGILYKLLNDVFIDRYKPIYILGYAYVYGLYMFFDFAGYSSTAIGTSYILGIKLPENFNKPFMSVDIKDFWNRWHITLSHWFRDFVFTRILLNFVRNKSFKQRINAAAVTLILNMTIMGIWHGLESHYIAYGVYHGCLLAITEVYQKKSTFYKKYKNNKVYIFCSWFITINAVMFGFLIFSGHMADIWNALKYKI